MSCSRSSRMSNSDRIRWKLTKQTMIRVPINLVQHTQCSNIRSVTQNASNTMHVGDTLIFHIPIAALFTLSEQDEWLANDLMGWYTENEPRMTLCMLSAYIYRLVITETFHNHNHSLNWNMHNIAWIKIILDWNNA